jgi:hypothetical protein
MIPVCSYMSIPRILRKILNLQKALQINSLLLPHKAKKLL